MALERLLRPHSVAVVGASPRTFVGTVVLENLRRLGFTGSVFPVSRHPEVAGYPAYPSLSDVPASVDIAVVQVQTSRVLSIVREGISAAIKSFVIPGAGFTDSGEAALRLVSDLQQLRQQCEFELVGPNCMGVLDLVSGAAPYIGTVTEHVRGGNVALVAQSGAVIEAIVNCGGRVPLSTAVSTGSESITGIADYIRFFVSDPHTNALLVFIETLNDPVALTESVRSMADAGKPVAVCVVGHSQTANEGIAAHSGRLAVGARLVSTALEQAGAIVAADLDELLALGELLGTQRSYPGGTRMHVVTNSGGEGNLVADLADQVGLDLPKVGERVRSALASSWPALTVRNPLDPWGADDYEQIYPQALRQVAGEPGDIVMVAMDQHAASGEHERRLGRDLANYLGQAVDGTGKYPVLLSPLSDDVDPELVQACRRSEVPLLRGARPGMAALASLARWTARPRNGAPKFDPECERRMSGLDVTGIVNEVQALDILMSAGVRTPRRIMAGDPTAAGVAARSMGCSVVLKGVADGVTHKTERGLVSVSPVDVETAASDMQLRNSDLALTFLVLEHIHGDLEVLVGYKRDAVFGPTVIVGVGGVWAEFHRDVSLHVGHVDRTLAASLLDQSTVGRMITSARGGPLDSTGVVDALVVVSELGRLNPDIVCVDINPVIVARSGATAVDAAIERRQTFSSSSMEGMIHHD